MLFGGAVVALALASGLSALARGGRRWLILLAPLLIATVGLRDPVFVALPLLLLAVAVVPPAGRRGRWTAFALLLLTASCALLTLVRARSAPRPCRWSA